MLTQVAEGVFVHESQFCQSNTVVVRGSAGTLVIDPGVHETQITCLAADVSALGDPIVVGFSTHPHWDHVLWHEDLGAAPRYGTARCAATIRERLSGGIDASRAGIPDDVSLSLLGDIESLGDKTQIPWNGPVVRVIEHSAHAPGHAALLIPSRGVLIAGDMLSDVLVPMLDLRGPQDPIGDYLDALQLLEDAAREVSVVIPGHGSVGRATEIRDRINLDRAYVLAMRENEFTEDPRVGTSSKEGWEWVTDVHEAQLKQLWG